MMLLLDEYVQAALCDHNPGTGKWLPTGRDVICDKYVLSIDKECSEELINTWLSFLA